MKVFRIIFAVCGILGARCLGETSNSDDGMPFGTVSDQEIASLVSFGLSQGVDLNVELEKAAAKKDAAALGKVFHLCLQFKANDRNVKAYEQAIYSSLLNIGEIIGEDRYAKVIGKQEPGVAQRIRDILYNASIRNAPKDERAQFDADIRKGHQALFPADFVFGLNDPAFSSLG